MKSGPVNQARNPDFFFPLIWACAIISRPPTLVVHKGDRADRLWGSHAPKHQKKDIQVLPIRGEIETMKTNYPSRSTDLSRERNWGAAILGSVDAAGDCWMCVAIGPCLRNDEVSQNLMAERLMKRERQPNVGKVGENDGLRPLRTVTATDQRFLLRVGVEWERFDFEFFGSIYPSRICFAAGEHGCRFDYQFKELWIMRAELQPGVYSDFRGIGWDDVDAPLALGPRLSEEPGHPVDLRDAS